MSELFNYIYLLCISIFYFIGIGWFALNLVMTIEYLKKEEDSIMFLVFSWTVWGTIIAMIIHTSQS